MQKLKLGTRRSLLAWAQSSWVAREIERLNPGLQVELEGIDTRGDKILDVSLRNVVGKEFFVAELDDALKSGRVDLTVHSMKDLSLDRPKEFVLGAIPRRENPRDVILFGPGVMDKIRAGKVLKIGTSSPRRLENIPPFLAHALPRAGGHEPKSDLVEIRGNVNTRLSRVHEPQGSERALDGVVLAFAGLIRLWADQAGRAELTQLLQGVRWMVLPLQPCPAAPAQGALAVECRAGDARVRDALAKLHDEATAQRVRGERQLLADWGGGCHQKFGATAIHSVELGEVMYVRGRKPDETFVEETRWKAPEAPARVSREQAWDGKEHRSTLSGEPLGTQLPKLSGRAMFVAHSRALADASDAKDARVWTSGVPSWFKLARQGVWVEGCAEGLGFEFVEPTLGEGVLQLPRFGQDWVVLTHDRAVEGWRDAQVLATYQVPEARNGQDERAAVVRARHLYWGSGSQFDQYGSHAAAGARHYCGPGKTAAYLRSRGVEPIVFPSAEEWRKWLKID